jgi:hypothetical protein
MARLQEAVTAVDPNVLLPFIRKFVRRNAVCLGRTKAASKASSAMKVKKKK